MQAVEGACDMFTDMLAGNWHGGVLYFHYDACHQITEQHLGHSTGHSLQTLI